jgi:hypothetical protein
MADLPDDVKHLRWAPLRRRAAVHFGLSEAELFRQEVAPCRF